MHNILTYASHNHQRPTQNKTEAEGQKNRTRQLAGCPAQKAKRLGVAEGGSLAEDGWDSPEVNAEVAELFGVGEHTCPQEQGDVEFAQQRHRPTIPRKPLD